MELGKVGNTGMMSVRGVMVKIVMDDSALMALIGRHHIDNNGAKDLTYV